MEGRGKGKKGKGMGMGGGGEGGGEGEMQVFEILRRTVPDSRSDDVNNAKLYDLRLNRFCEKEETHQ